MSGVRVRFPPSPSGDLHVGNVRSALFNYAFARHERGAFVFRIEDTDTARSTEESYRSLLADLRWLGLDWDEGPQVGGEYGPYRQSERTGLYADVAARLRGAGYGYDCYCTAEEVATRNRAAGRPAGYDGHCRDLTESERDGHLAAGRTPVLRFRMPGERVEFTDLVRGTVGFDAEHVPDYVLVRADGSPLYTLTNPVDDALMRITHVLRGEDLLASTPRQIPLHRALRDLGISDAPMPAFGHLPFVMGEGNRKLSKRETPEVSLNHLRARGYLPEAVLNYLALLGWSMGEDTEIFTLDQMCRAFTLDRVGVNPARFDPKKLLAVNGTKIRALSTDEFADRVTPFLIGAGLVADPPTVGQAELLRAAAPLVRERTNLLTDAVGMLGFLFADGDAFTVDEAAAAKQLTGAHAGTVKAAVAALEPLPGWTADNLQAALREALVDRLGLKPKHAFGPVRVAVTGRQVSPPLFESLELLGRDRTLARLRDALSRVGE
ncbi:MAG TPA: glutamate--tRNA ligase [Mycobacteriales bacterium]|nr:glutamate--tRNA ligase [Mycobacteriales bacterium]